MASIIVVIFIWIKLVRGQSSFYFSVVNWIITDNSFKLGLYTSI